MRFSIITSLYCVLLMVICFTAFSMRQNEVLYETEQRRQDIQSDYATDAAVLLMLYETPDLGLDYSELSNIMVDPQVALDTFEAVMIRGLGWSDEEYTREYFEDSYMPFFIVCAYDGYYVYGVVREQAGDTFKSTIYPKIWSPKIPYAETVKNGSKTFINMYNLGTDTYNVYDYETNTFKSMYYKDGQHGSKAGANNATTTDMKVAVANQLTEACQKSLIAAKGDVVEESIIIPSSFSEWSSNRPVEYPTVLAYVNAITGNTKYEHATFAIGGSRIQEGNYYIAYVKNYTDVNGVAHSVKSYTSAIYRDVVENELGYKVDKVFTSQTDAALSGYYYDLYFVR